MHSLPILIFGIALGGGGKGSGSGSYKDDKKEIVPKQKEITDIDIIKVPGLGKKKVPHEGLDCPDFFGGIGVQITRGVVDGEPRAVFMEVVKGYPADLAGIRVGDQLISPRYEHFDSIKGEVGTEVDVTYRSSDGDHMVTLVRDKICVKSKETP